jgi:hypothetical protein
MAATKMRIANAEFQVMNYEASENMHIGHIDIRNSAFAIHHSLFASFMAPWD